jgi:hypothetical protein
VSIQNSGTAPLNLGALSLTTGTDYAVNHNTCQNLVLVPGASCTLDVTFTPTTLGQRSDSLVIPSNVPGSPTTVALTGIGVYSGLSVSPSPVNFGSQTVGSASSPMTLTLTDTGSGLLVLGTLSVPTGSVFAISNDECSGKTLVPVAPGLTSCTVVLTYTPTAMGSVSDNLSIPSNAPATPGYTGPAPMSTTLVALSGQGLQAGLSATPSPVSFASTGVGKTSDPMTVTITNTGNAPLMVTAATIATGDIGDFAITQSTCGSSLAVGANCTVTVIFKPTASGTRNAGVTVTSNAAGSPQTLMLTGVASGSGGGGGALNLWTLLPLAFFGVWSRRRKNGGLEH